MNSINIKNIILYFLLHSSSFLIGMDNRNHQRIELTVGFNINEPIAYHATLNGLQVKVPVKVINYKTINTKTGQPISRHMSFFPRYLPLKIIQNSKEEWVQIGNIYDINGRLVMASAGTLVENDDDFVHTAIEENTLCFYNRNQNFFHVPVKITFHESFEELLSQKLADFNNKPVVISEPVWTEEYCLEYATNNNILEVHGKELYHAEAGFPNERKLEGLDRSIKHSNGLFNALKDREIGHNPKSRLKKTPPLIQHSTTTE